MRQRFRFLILLSSSDSIIRLSKSLITRELNTSNCANGINRINNQHVAVECSSIPALPVAKIRLRSTSIGVDREEESGSAGSVGSDESSKSKWASYNGYNGHNGDFDKLPYESALRVLEAYHKSHGDLVIPRGFVVPTTKEYPSEWHGAKLSRHIYDMKWWQTHIAKHSDPSDRVATLNKLGFIWERLQPEWNLFILAITSYSSIYGNVMVPVSFVVPHDDDESWPKATWGFPLGNVVYRVRYRHDFLSPGSSNFYERKQQLDGLRFVWDVGEYNFSKFIRALRHFDALEKRNNLQLASLASEYRTVRVPSKFVVPSNHPEWPREFWNYPLGAKCMAVRQKQLYVKNHDGRKRALEEIGFRWSGNATLGWLEVVHAAAIYSRMHGRCLDVPLDFVVPAPPRVSGASWARGTSSGATDGQHEQYVQFAQWEDSWPWPEQLWGLKLGQRLKDVRLKGAYLKGEDANIRRAQLDGLGMVWNPKRGRRRRFLGDGSRKESGY